MKNTESTKPKEETKEAKGLHVPNIASIMPSGYRKSGQRRVSVSEGTSDGAAIVSEIKSQSDVKDANNSTSATASPSHSQAIPRDLHQSQGTPSPNQSRVLPMNLAKSGDAQFLNKHMQRKKSTGNLQAVLGRNRRYESIQALFGSEIAPLDKSVPRAAYYLQFEQKLRECLPDSLHPGARHKFVVHSCKKDSHFFRQPPLTVPPPSESVPEYLSEAIAFYNDTHYRYVQFYPSDAESFPSHLHKMDEEDMSEDPIDEGSTGASLRPSSGSLPKKINPLKTASNTSLAIINRENLRPAGESESAVTTATTTNSNSTSRSALVASIPSLVPGHLLTMPKEPAPLPPLPSTQDASSGDAGTNNPSALNTNSLASNVANTSYTNTSGGNLTGRSGKSGSEPYRIQAGINVVLAFGAENESGDATVPDMEKLSVSGHSLDVTTDDELSLQTPRESSDMELHLLNSLPHLASFDESLMGPYNKASIEKRQKKQDAKLKSLLFKPIPSQALTVPDSFAKKFHSVDPTSVRCTFRMTDLLLEKEREDLRGEPLLLSFALYDVKTKQKLSEDFLCPWNYTPSTTATAIDDLVTSTNICVFHTIPNENCYFIAKVSQLTTSDKVFALTQSAAGWFDKSSKKEKEKDGKLEKGKSQQWAKAIIEYDRLPLFWGATQFLLLGEQKNRKIELFPMTKKQSDDQSILESGYFDEDKSRKKEKASATIIFETNFTKREGMIHGVVSPSYQPLKPFSSKRCFNQRTYDNSLKRLIQSFGPEHLFTSVVNNLYVYPLRLHNMKPKAPIHVYVSLKDDDQEVNADYAEAQASLPVIYGLPFDARFVKSARTATCPAETTSSSSSSSSSSSGARVSFIDEVKMALPHVLRPKLHLLFTVVSLERDKKTGLKAVVLGYAYHSLLSKGKFCVASGWSSASDVELPLVNSLQSGYLSASTNEDSKEGSEKSGGKRTLVVKMHTITSLYSSEKHLQAFFNPQQNKISSVHPNAIYYLQQVKKNTQFKFAPFLMWKVMKIMCTSQVESDLKDSVACLLTLIQHLNDQFISKENVVSFTNHYLDIQYPDRVNLPHETFVKYFLILHAESHKAVTSFSVWWILIHILNRLIAFYLTDENLKQSNPSENLKEGEKDLPYGITFSNEFARDVVDMLVIVFGKVTTSPLSSCDFMAVGLSELLTLIDKGLVLYLIVQYLRRTTDDPEETSTLMQTKLSLYKSFCSRSFYYLNLPSPIDTLEGGRESTTEPAEEGGLDFKQFRLLLQEKHVIGGELINVIIDLNTSTQAATLHLREKAIGTLASILHDSQGDWDNIAAIYFPFLLYLIEEIGNAMTWWDHMLLNQQESTLKSTYLSCALYLLGCLSEPVIDWWFINETSPPRRRGLLILLREIVQFFKSSPASGQASKVVIDVMMRFIAVQNTVLHTPGIHRDSLIIQITALMGRLFTLHDVATEKKLIQLVHQLVDTCGFLFFNEGPSDDDGSGGYSNLDKLVFEFLLKLCASSSSKLRVGGYTLFYRIVKKSFLTSKTIQKAKGKATVAISKLMGLQDYRFTELKSTINLLKILSQNEKPSLPTQTGRRSNETKNSGDPSEGDLEESGDSSSNLTSDSGAVGLGRKGGYINTNRAWISAFGELVEHINTIIERYASISDNKSDPEMLAGLYLTISETFSDSPILRFTWLESLESLHVENNNFLEAGQCQMFMAALILRDLRKRKKLTFYLPPFFESHMLTISPNAPVYQVYVDEVSETDWSVKTLEEKINVARSFFTKATYYELALETTSLLELLQRSKKEYKLLSTPQNTDIIEKLTNPALDRLLPLYFRVGFYGGWEPNLKGKQFIYKKFNMTLGSMKQALEAQFTKYGEKLEVLTSNTAIDEEKLDASGKCFIQLVGVFGLMSAEEATVKTTIHDKNFNLKKFYFESAFTDGGKAHSDDIGQQRKKKTIFTTAHPFPHVETRVLVESVEEINLSPIENAIELIQGQIQKIKHELSKNPVAINPLQQCLQGSVIPMVNPGPTRICEIFLKVEDIAKGVNEKRHVVRLIEVLKDFMRSCRFAVLLNARVAVEEKYIKLTELITTNYENLQKFIDKSCENATLALKSS